jgi:hypothetical protein
MNKYFLSFVTFFLLVSYASSSNEWHYKFANTKTLNSQFSISCDSDDQIWIGWSHYGTRDNSNNNSIQKKDSSPGLLNFPNESDCWMNFTEKIAEQCNGASQCELSSQPTYIHKCGKTSDYLYVTFKCIPATHTHDICTQMSKTYALKDLENNGVYIKSSDFPDEYSSSLDCSCMLNSRSSSNLKFEFLWFSLQDNDYLQIFNKNLSGWMNPTHEMPIGNNQKSNLIRFMTDDSLAYKGFWLKVTTQKTCKNSDWQLIGDSCIKVIEDNVDYRTANQRCQSMNANLLKIDDVINDLKLTQYVKHNYPELGSYWIGLRKSVDKYNQEKWMWSLNSTVYNDVSWWPWRAQQNSTYSSPIHNNHCAVKKKNEDGYFTTLCDTKIKNSFICQSNTVFNTVFSNKEDDSIQLKCGQSDQILKEFSKPEKDFKSIGSSIKNVKIVSHVEPEIIEEIIITSPIPSPSSFSPLPQISKQQLTFKPQKSSQSNILPQIITAEPSLNSEQQKVNTAVLAGIVTGIGLVILIINVGVLFMCRRNLKKLLKSTTNSKDHSNNPSQEDIIQEYFESLHHNSKSLINQPTLLLNPAQSSTIKTDSIINLKMSGNEPEQQFFFPNSAFKPVLTSQNEQNLLTLHKQLLMAAANNNNNQHDILNQYDKINHHQLSGMLQQQPIQGQVHKMVLGEEAAGQYAHTYECLDNLEVPLRHQQLQQQQQFNRNGTLVHLGINGRNYRTLIHNSNGLSLPAQQISPSDLINNSSDLSTTSSSSSSGTSSTHQLLKTTTNNNNNSNFDNMINFQPQHQFIQISDLKQLNQFLTAQNNISNSNNLIDVSNGGAWSPDSAYYSSICNNSNNLNSAQILINPNLVQHDLFNSHLHNNNQKSHLV